MNKNLINGTLALLFILVVCASAASAQDTITRDLPATADAGTTITVNLTVDVESGATFYAIDDTLPTGWNVASATSEGDYTSESGHVKWAVVSGAADTGYSYTVSIPAGASGTYTFDGIYAFEGMTAEATIIGDTVVDVEGGTAAPTITAHDPAVTDTVATRTFSITTDQIVDVLWQINSTTVQTDSDVTSASYTNTSAAHGIRNVSAVASNTNGIAIQRWLWTVEFLPGDLNSNGSVTSADAAIALEIAAGSHPCDPATLVAADVSSDGKVISLDALILIQMATGAISLR